MLIVAYIVFGFAVVQLLVALVNLIFSQRLPQPDPTYNPLVSILIPARNEAQNIGNLLKDLQAQPYKNIEVLVFDDQSEDETAAVAGKFVVVDERINLFHSKGLPEGWLGKNHGCYSLAQKAKGEFFLFLDADVRISGNVLHQTISKVRKQHLGLLTVFPKQTMQTWGEWFVVPSMNYILLSLLPLILVRLSKFESLSAANGQFMLFDAETYLKHQPHKKHKMMRVEDISIARSFKESGIRIACLSAINGVRCRMYSGFNDAGKGLSRSVIMFFGNSVLLAILFWIITTAGFIFVLLKLSMAAFIIYLSMLIMTRICISLASRQNILKNLLLGFFQKWVLGYVIYLAIHAQTKQAYEWKGRKVS